MNTLANHKQILSGALIKSANLFLWVAGFTVINTILAFTKASFEFAFSLGIVDIANSVIPSESIAITFSLVMAGIFAGLGWFARSGNVVIFIVGMVLYTLDGLLLLLAGPDWLGLAVHAYILFRLFKGVQYAFTLKKLIKQEEEQLKQERIANASPVQW